MLLFTSHIKFALIATIVFASFQPIVAQNGCSAIDNSKPALFISFAQVDDKSWDGSKYVRGALLKLTNNSNCTITFSAEVDTAPKVPSSWILRNGKMVRRADVPFGSLNSGQRVSLYYLTKYPKKKYLVIGGFGGDVLETVYLNGGDHAFFGVPLTNFKRGGEILLPYTYSWDEGERGQIIAKENGYVRRYETVEHYLRFVGEQLPDGTLK
jgi:hypothetical protein